MRVCGCSGDDDDAVSALDAALIASAQAVEHYETPGMELSAVGRLTWASKKPRSCWERLSRRKRRPINWPSSGSTSERLDRIRPRWEAGYKDFALSAKTATKAALCE
jgi:hypothetical protein